MNNLKNSVIYLNSNRGKMDRTWCQVLNPEKREKAGTKMHQTKRNRY